MSAPRPAGAPAPSGGDAAPPHIAFIEDDYARALAEARRTHRPLFIDAWATWCHTCVSMRAYVFPDPILQAHADEVVWASIDTERPENAAWVEAHPMTSWPTLWVIEPETERVVLKWSNSATASELVALLGDATAAMQRGDRSSGEAIAALVRGNEATAAGKNDEAIAAYRSALSAAPRDWPRRASAVESLLERLRETKDHAACAALAREELPRLAPGTSRVTAALVGLECAARLPAGGPSLATKAAIESAARAMALDPNEPILADDRSGLFEALVDAKKEEKNPAEARVLASAWAAFLEGEAKKAATPAARAVFDPHRLNAYIEVGAPARALPMLDESERDFPADYNPPARLGRAYFEMHRYEDAVAALDRALARVYGPRMLRVFALKADALAAKGDTGGVRATLTDALARTRGMPLPGASYAKLRGDLEGRLRTLEKAVK